MNPLYRSVIEKFENLSEGERSCLLHVLQTPSAQQLTAKGSAHDQFYWELKSLGWAESAPLDDSLASFSSAWTLTAEGRDSFPDLLMVREIERQKQDCEERLSSESFRLGAKFGAGYIAIQIAAMLAANVLARLGVNVAAVSDLLLGSVQLASCAAGVLAAITPWTFGRPPRSRFDDVAMFGQMLAMRARSGALCVYFAPPIFLFHLVMEYVILRYNPAYSATLVGSPVLRSFIMTALVCFGCWWIAMPAILDARIERYRRR